MAALDRPRRARHGRRGCAGWDAAAARRAGWDVDGVRDDLRGWVVEQLGEPHGVLIVDESGFLEKGAGPPGCRTTSSRSRIAR